MPTPGNQGNVASCVSWAVGYTLYGYYVRTEHLSGGDHAPMYLYSQAHLTHSDGGGGSYYVNTGGHPGNLNIARGQGVDTIADYGGISNATDDWQTLPTSSQRANSAHYTLAGFNTLFSNWTSSATGAVDDVTAIEVQLAHGNPVALLLTVYGNFGTQQNGVWNYWGPESYPFRGLHALVAVGYNQNGIIVENEWGSAWGVKGFDVLTFSFLETAWPTGTTAGPLVPIGEAYTVSGVS